MDMELSANNPFKWERAITLMQQVNQLSEIIRGTPAARKIIPNPKSYSSELNMAREKAAEARYNAGSKLLEQDNRETARIAFDHFYRETEILKMFLYRTDVDRLIDQILLEEPLISESRKPQLKKLIESKSYYLLNMIFRTD